MVAALHNRMSADAFQRYAAAHGRCELIRGEVRDLSPAGGRHGELAAELAFWLRSYLRESKRGGRTFGAETGFRLDDDGEPTVRAPDVAYVGPERADAADTPKFVPIPPDLAGEILSPDDRASEVTEKTRWWLSHGVRIVWVVDPANRSVTVHHPDGSARVLGEGATLDGGDVLPGFALPLTSLFGHSDTR